MPITRTPWIDDDGTGTTGTVINNAEKQAIYNQIDALVNGVLVNHPFTAADYTANNGATWTIQGVEYRYARIADVLFVWIYVTGSTLAGTPSNLFVALPPNVFAKATGTGASYVSHAAAPWEPGVVLARKDSHLLELYRPGLGTYGAGSVVAYLSVAIQI
jgi:hypothetical protein